MFKESNVYIHPKIKSLTDTGYQGIQKLHWNSKLSKKKTKKNPLTKDDKKKNRELSNERILNENVIGMLKRFKIIADRYRNRRKRFALRFNLIAGIYNYECKNWSLERGLLKVELIHQNNYLTIDDSKSSIFQYIIIKKHILLLIIRLHLRLNVTSYANRLVSVKLG